MGHLTGKDVYHRLAGKIDNTPVRTPDTPAFRALLRELYTPEEADLVVRMPYRPATLERIAAVCRMERPHVRRLLDTLCGKGLVLDIRDESTVTYMISPIVIGIFEFTMMRTGGDLPYGAWARLFHDYMFGDTSFFDANFGDGQRISIMRALPHEEAVNEGARVEILDHERAAALVDRHGTFAVGLCSCRHEKVHIGQDPCDAPLDTCTSMGTGAEFLIRNGFARRIDKAEMRDILARSRDLGLTLSTDNVRQDAGFICHCCGCCCNLMQGMKTTGYTGILVSSNWLAACDAAACNGCGLCVRACPVEALRLVDRATQDTAPHAGRDAGDAKPEGGRTTTETAPPPAPSGQTSADMSRREELRGIPHPRHEGADATPPQARRGRRRVVVVETSACLGCGVCALKCPTGALQLEARPARVFHPEDSFERVILQSLERGTFQNLIFDNPNSRTQAFMRGLVGGFLRLDPVKRALMGDTLRSRFLNAIRNTSL